MKQQTAHLEIQTVTLGDGVLVSARAHGTLDGADYDVLLPELDAVLAAGGPVSFLFIMEQFRGWDIESFARELKWDEKNRNRLRKIAIVGDAGWQKWSTLLSKWFVPGNVRYFDRTQETAARTWLGQ